MLQRRHLFQSSFLETRHPSSDGCVVGAPGQWAPDVDVFAQELLVTGEEREDLQLHAGAGGCIAAVPPPEEAAKGGGHRDLTHVEEVDHVVLELDSILEGRRRGTEGLIHLVCDLQGAGLRTHRWGQPRIGVGGLAGCHLLGVETGGLLHVHLFVFCFKYNYNTYSQPLGHKKHLSPEPTN